MKESLPSKSWPALTGRRSGFVRLEQNRAIFSYDDPLLTQFELPYLGLRISVSGKNSHHYLLTHPSMPEQEICVQTSEPSVGQGIQIHEHSPPAGRTHRTLALPFPEDAGCRPIEVSGSTLP